MTDPLLSWFFVCFINWYKRKSENLFHFSYCLVATKKILQIVHKHASSQDKIHLALEQVEGASLATNASEFLRSIVKSNSAMYLCNAVLWKYF